jgi:hypothetical protein
VCPFGSIRRFLRFFFGLLTPWYDVEIISISDSNEHFGVANDRALARRKHYRMLPSECDPLAFILKTDALLR